MRAWERLERETSKAFEAFKLYRDMGSSRTLSGAWRIHKGFDPSDYRVLAPGRWQGWYRDFDWKDRAHAHDDFKEMIRRQAIEDYERSKAGEYAARQERIREQIMDNAEKAAKQAAEMLEAPLFVETTSVDEKTGEITKIVHPAKWTKETVARYQEIAHKAVGDSFGDDVNVNINVGEEDVEDKNFAKLTVDEQREHLRLVKKLRGSGEDE